MRVPCLSHLLAGTNDALAEPIKIFLPVYIVFQLEGCPSHGSTPAGGLNSKQDMQHTRLRSRRELHTP